MHFSAITLAATIVASAFSSISAEPLKAIATFAGPNGTVTGTIRFTQEDENSQTIVFANISGLAPGEHGIHIHQFGDLSGGCASNGPHFNPFNVSHGSPEADVHHPGDFGNIAAQLESFAILRLASDSVKLFGNNSVIGRGIVVHAGEDDLGLGDSPLSKTTGNSGDRVACGVIGYSST